MLAAYWDLKVVKGNVGCGEQKQKLLPWWRWQLYLDMSLVPLGIIPILDEGSVRIFSLSFPS